MQRVDIPNTASATWEDYILNMYTYICIISICFLCKEKQTDEIVYIIPPPGQMDFRSFQNIDGNINL